MGGFALPTTAAGWVDLGSSALDIGSNLFGSDEGKYDYRVHADWNKQLDKKYQKQIMMESPTWLKIGAQRAGLHPLAMLGSTSFNPSAQSMGGMMPGETTNKLAAMSQSLDRAHAKMMNSAQKKLFEEQLRGVKIDNDIKQMELDSKLRLISGDQTAGKHPYTLIDGNPFDIWNSSSNVQTVPVQRDVSPDKNHLQQVAGSQPMIEFYNDGKGLRPYAAGKFKQSIEDMGFFEFEAFLDLKFGPMWHKKYKPTLKELRVNYPGAIDSYFDGRRYVPLYDSVVTKTGVGKGHDTSVQAQVDYMIKDLRDRFGSWVDDLLIRSLSNQKERR
jgi:hypothetical protein